jgi:hypothetical protein
LSKLPAQKDWAAQEAALIDFVGTKLRQIVAHVITKRPEILTIIKSNVISDAQQKFASEMQDPSMASRYAGMDPTTSQAAQMERFKYHLQGCLMSKITNKVYRKKKDAPKDGSAAPVNFLDLSAQFDETKFPTLYATIQSFISKKTKTEEFISNYYQFVPDVPEDQWPRLTHAEAVAKGWQTVQLAVRFDKIYFGASIAPQLTAAEVVFKKAIENNLGHKGRLIQAAADIPRNSRLISRTAIQPAGVNNNNNDSNHGQARPETGLDFSQQFQSPTAAFQGAPPMFQQQAPQQQLPSGGQPQVMAFDPTGMNIPGIGALAPPQITSNYGSGTQ